MPPIDIDAVRSRSPGYYSPPTYEPAPSYPYEGYGYEEEEDDYRAFQEADAPGFDVYGVVLGVLAAVAVLGLIPLWITVYLTLSR